MQHTIGDYPVLAFGATVGHVSIAQDGLMTVFESTCNFESLEVLRLAAVCSSAYVPLGVMIPDGASLRMKKSFTKNALKSLGYVEPESFHLIRSGDVYLGDDILSDAADAADVLETSEVSPEQPMTEDMPEEVLLAQDADVVVYNDFPEPVDYGYAYEPKASLENTSAQPCSSAAPEPMFVAQENDQMETSPEVEIQGKKDVLQELKAFLEKDDDTAVPGDKKEAMPNHPPTLQTAHEQDGWVNIAHPSELFTDPSVKEASTGVYGALTMEQDGHVLLAVPVVPDEPFPMMPVFCFGSSGQLFGREYIIFKIKDGNLTL